MREFFLLLVSVGWMLCMNWSRLRRYQCLQVETLISNSACGQHSKLYWHLWQICKGEGKERKWREKIKQMRDGADIHPKKGGPIDCSCQDKLPSTNRFSGWSLLGLGGAHSLGLWAWRQTLLLFGGLRAKTELTTWQWHEKHHWGQRECGRHEHKIARIFALWLIY